MGERTTVTLHTMLPESIEKAYRAALKVQDIEPNACAVLARRTLEAIFIYEKAEGKTPMEKVNNLIKSDRIPPLLADMAHLHVAFKTFCVPATLVYPLWMYTVEVEERSYR